MAEAFERILRDANGITQARRYRDIDTFYLRIAQGNCIGLSSGHNHAQFEGRAAFLPLVGVDTSYNVVAQWLKGSDERIADVFREAARACSDYMRNWSDGVG